MLESIRKRIVLAGFILGLMFLIIFWLGFQFTYGNSVVVRFGVPPNPIAREISSFLLMAGLYVITFLSAGLGALLGSDTLSGEINSGAIQSIVSKPIRRLEIVIGKWLAYAILLAIYSVIMTGGTVFSVWIQSGYFPKNVLSGQLLIYFESVLIMTIAIACSSFLPGLAAGGTVFSLYGIALIGGWIEQLGAITQNDSAIKIGIIISLLIPSESLWRRASFEMQYVSTSLLMSPFGVVSVPSPLMIVYSVFYLLLTLCFAIYMFQKRDL